MSVIVKKLGPSGRTTLDKFKNKPIAVLTLSDEEFAEYNNGTKSIYDILKDRKES